MSEPLHWERKEIDWSTGIVFGVMFGIVFGMMMDDYIMGIAIGLAFAAAFGGFPEKHEAHFDGQVLRLKEKHTTAEVDAANVADVIVSESGAMVVRTTAGERHSVEAGGDAAGLAAFARQLRAVLPVAP